MSKMFWYKVCPFCNQGRLFVFKNLKTNELYLHCEECERGYLDTRHIDVEHSFLTILEDFEATAATERDINETDWKSLIYHVVAE